MRSTCMQRWLYSWQSLGEWHFCFSLRQNALKTEWLKQMWPQHHYADARHLSFVGLLNKQFTHTAHCSLPALQIIDNKKETIRWMQYIVSDMNFWITQNPKRSSEIFAACNRWSVVLPRNSFAVDIVWIANAFDFFRIFVRFDNILFLRWRRSLQRTNDSPERHRVKMCCHENIVADNDVVKVYGCATKPGILWIFFIHVSCLLYSFS